MNIGGTEVAIRAMEPGDRAFILSTWLRSAKDKSRLPRDRFFRLMRPQVEADIENGIVVVACDAKTRSTIYAWAAFRDGVLRWAYVAFGLRGQGLLKYIKESYAEAESEALAA